MVQPHLSRNFCVKVLILHLCSNWIRSSLADNTKNVNFLRSVVAPVEVPGLLEGEESPGIRELTLEDFEEERLRFRELREQRKARSWEQEDLSMLKPDKLEPMPEEHIQRELGYSWGGSSKSSSSGTTYSESVVVDPSKDYDKWAQAYRFLGAYIDCDYDWRQNNKNNNKNNNNNNNKNNNNNNNNNYQVKYCSRWMIFACYINPNYQGREYNEYFGNDPPGKLDCHLSSTSWKLLGIYRQEHYQFIEQISKHLWAINEEEYVIALAGLAYMTKYQCFQVAAAGNNGNSNSLYVAVTPVSGGDSQLALYTDEQCIVKDTTSGKKPGDFGLTNSLDLGSKDKENDKSYAYQYWQDAQEDTLTDMNTVYQKFKYCTSCVDYPTYQDGYFIGDSGTDDDDLINQCWKFWSHDAFVCEHDCLSKASAQGGILKIDYGSQSYGVSTAEFYNEGQEVSSSAVAAAETPASAAESPLARLLANAFLTLTFLLFVATFLAFAVARRSRYREGRSSRSRRLLDDTDQVSRQSASRRSKSRENRDGLMREKSTQRGSSRSGRTSRSRGPSGRKK